MYPNADIPTSSSHPDTNFNYYSENLDVELWTGNFSDGSGTRTYLRFNLEGLFYIGSATLYMYNGLNSGGRSSFAPASVEVYTISSELPKWSERAITWNNQPGLTGAAWATETVGTAVGWYTWNVTSLAQAKANGYLSLGLTSTGAGHVYYGRESESDYMPFLVTSSVPEPATIISFSSFILIFLPGIRRKILG